MDGQYVSLVGYEVVMRLKYYLRTLGLAIIMTALLMGVATSNKQSMSDDQIKQRALELGMVDPASVVLADLKGEETAEQEAKTEESKELLSEDSQLPSEEMQEITSSEENGQETFKQGEEEQDSNAYNSEKETEKENKQDASVTSMEEPEDVTKTEENNTPETEIKDSLEVVSFSVKKGDSSSSVSVALAAVGLVQDAAAYDQYLCRNGYDKIISVGTYEIPVGSSDQEIAQIITGKR